MDSGQPQLQSNGQILDKESFVNKYKHKLYKFNTTINYGYELEYLKLLMSDSKRVLDYGCGTGFAVMKLQDDGIDCFGTDINDYYSFDEMYFIKQPKRIKRKFDCVFFMHSLAHIKNDYSVLKLVKDKLLKEGGKVIVITPNLDHLNRLFFTLEGPDPYIPDPTVIQHFDTNRLSRVFREVGFDIIAQGSFSSFPGGWGNDERLFLVATT